MKSRLLAHRPLRNPVRLIAICLATVCVGDVSAHGPTQTGALKSAPPSDALQEKLAGRTRNILNLDPGQREIQDAMYGHADAWYDLSYVRNDSPPTEDRGEASKTTRPGVACRETDIRLSDNIDEFPLFSAIPANVYPGSIIKGDTLLTATYGVFSGPRNSAKITINTPGGDKTIGTEIMNPISQSQYFDALRRLLKGGIGPVPAGIAFSIDRIFSDDQLSFKMSANVSGSSFKVNTQFKIDSKTTKQYALISVTQTYFRVYLDRPDYGAEYFAANLSRIDIDNIKREMTATNPPLYVSAMDYGRKAYILFETSNSTLDIEAMLSAGYKGVVEADGKIDAKVRQALESMSARGFIIGGSSQVGANTLAELFAGKNTDGVTALEGVKTWLISGAEPSDKNPPAALAYEFALLLDGSKSLARTTTNYKETDCNVGVCPSGFYWGKKYFATWFEINVRPNPKIYPSAALIGDKIQLQDGSFYTYTFPTCDRIYWRNVALKCVANERRDFQAGVSPPGVWVWDDHPSGARTIDTDKNCFDVSNTQENLGAWRVNVDGAPPVPLDGKDEGFAKDPAAYWKWKE